MRETEKAYDVKFGESTLFVGDKGLFHTAVRLVPQAH